MGTGTTIAIVAGAGIVGYLLYKGATSGCTPLNPAGCLPFTARSARSSCCGQGRSAMEAIGVERRARSSRRVVGLGL